MVGWHHQLNAHEFEQTPRDSEGQGSLAYCSPWGHKDPMGSQRSHGVTKSWTRLTTEPQ